jgi:hypothetical protein
VAAKRTHCHYCGNEVSPSGETGLSRKGLHLECATQRAADAALQVSRREGPYYEAWREGMVRAGLRVA